MFNKYITVIVINSDDSLFLNSLHRNDPMMVQNIEWPYSTQKLQGKHNLSTKWDGMYTGGANWNPGWDNMYIVYSCECIIHVYSFEVLMYRYMSTVL